LNNISVYTSRSTTTTDANRTGTWRFLRPEYREKTAPCSSACPAGTDIARVQSQVSRRNYTKALRTILKENPFPAVCGRVCFRPCEKGCNRGAFDQPVSIQRVERHLGDIALNGEGPILPEKAPDNGYRVAVVGAGPAGLSAAYFLRMLGFSCEVYDANEEPGGILRWGIPTYRLPDPVIAAEVERIIRLGVKIHTGTSVDRAALHKLLKENDALFLGCGLGRSMRLNIPGDHLVKDGLGYLRAVRSGTSPDIAGTAVVIGGGNTAVDLSRTLIRKGASKVILIYRRRREDMPAFREEVDSAVKEGVRMTMLTAPVRIEAENRALVVNLQSMKPVEISAGKRARVVPDGNRPTQIRSDHLFLAIGAEADPFWEEEHPAAVLSHCRVVYPDKPVILGGDLTNAVRSVPDAVASGKQAAITLDLFYRKGLSGMEKWLDDYRVGMGPSLSMEVYRKGPRRFTSSQIVTFDQINTDYFDKIKRLPESALNPKKNARSFSEIYATLSAPDTTAESARCFSCGRCTACDNCRWFCPEVAVSVEGSRRRIETDWCKGCGICVAECPGNAMALVEESP